MIIVIIAGGSGTRLWPLSTPEYPKHLLKIGDEDLSLLQQTYERAKRLSDTVYVVSEAGHIHHVKEQLPDATEESFIVEPARRGTANCILATLVSLAERHDSDESIAFLPADHYIRDIEGFVHSFSVADASSKQQKQIVLIGVEPDYPATGFGYIQKDRLLDQESYVYSVDSFKEKPDFETAQHYLQSGNYLWNCGYFVGSLGTFKDTMSQYAPSLAQNYETLTQLTGDAYNEAYLGLKSQSIDYALIEKVDNLLVVPASFDWMDLGSFADMAKVVSGAENGNYSNGVVQLEEVNNSFVENQEEKPVVIIGLDNCVVINTPQGVLVTRKDLSQKVGEVSKRLQG